MSPASDIPLAIASLESTASEAPVAEERMLQGNDLSQGTGLRQTPWEPPFPDG
jgi:hypothetical protein